MAIERTITNVSRLAAENENQQQQPYETEGQVDAPDIMQILVGTDQAASLSSEGMEYIRVFNEAINSFNGSDTFKVYTLGSPAETQVVICDHHGQKHAIALAFDEAISKQTINTPAIAVQKMVFTQFKSRFGDSVAFEQLVIVNRHDYPKARVMASNVINALVGTTRDELTVDSLRNYKLELVPNINQVKPFMERLSPHGIPDRMDFGFNINIVPLQNSGMTKNIFSQTQDERSTLASVAGYTTFVRYNQPYIVNGMAMNSSGVTIYPVVHISSIQTPLQVKGILGLVIPLAAISFIDNAQWEFPFRRFDKNQVNIGNLVTDTNGAPLEITTLQEYERFKASYLRGPVLAMDVNNGHFMLPGLVDIGMTKEAGASDNFDFGVKESIARFLKVDTGMLGDLNHPLGQLVATEFGGVVTYGGSYMDSRYVDYLNLCIHNKSQLNRIADLLQPNNPPELLANLVREFFPDLDLYYYTHRVLLNSSMLNAAKMFLRKRVSVMTPESGSNYLNSSVYADAANQYQQTNNISAGTSSIYSPFYSNKIYY